MLAVTIGVLLGVAGAAGRVLLANGASEPERVGGVLEASRTASSSPLSQPPATTVGGSGGESFGATAAPSSPSTSSAAPVTSSSAGTPSPSGKSSAAQTLPVPEPGAARAALPDDSLAAQELALVNGERAKAGCAALAEEPHLDKAAQEHSDDMARQKYLSHTSLDGTTFDQRIKRAGYSRPAGENIARGQASVAQAMNGWMHSPGHRGNILNCGYRKIGIGVTPSGRTWVQDFGF